MDFSRIELDPAHQALHDQIKSFTVEYVTPEELRDEHEISTGFSERLHLALGERGWIMPHWPKERGGADLDELGVFLLERELAIARAPYVSSSTTQLIVPAIERFASDEIREDVLLGVAKGTVRLCLGYTEPHGGSDIASARTKAVRDGNQWVVNGAKMFITGAVNCQYVFLIVRTDPTVPKHRGLTMLLAPLDLPGIEIRPIHTFSGEQTTMLFFDDVRIDDRYRLGEPNEGWTVLRGPLDAEHGAPQGTANPGLRDLSIGTNFLREAYDSLGRLLDWADTPGPDGRRPADDSSILERIGRIATECDVALSTPGASGRVRGGEVTVWAAAEMLDMLGTQGLVTGGPDAIGSAHPELLHRYAQGTVTYGGTVEVFRSMIAQHELGLPRMVLPGTKAFVTSGS